MATRLLIEGESACLACGNTMCSMIYRDLETVLCVLIRQHYSVRAEDIKGSVRLRQLPINAVSDKNEQKVKDLACRIITPGHHSSA